MCGGTSLIEKLSLHHILYNIFSRFEALKDQICGTLSALRDYDTAAQNILNELRSSVGALKHLLEKYDSVAQKTTSLHEACDQLMADQTKLASAAEEIRSRLAYFDHAEQLTHKLNSFSLAVTGESFMLILSTIDECMTFLGQHPDYKETNTYMNRYRQCLSKALNLAKQYFSQLLTQTSQNVISKLNAGVNKEEDSFILYYGIFSTHAAPIHLLMEKLENKWDLHVEYQDMLTECYQRYLTQRQSLILPSITTTTNQLIKKHTGSCCSLVRSGCSFLLRVCEDEFRLFFQFFSRPTNLLYDFVETLCRGFYDVVRPIIIHVSHLETLSEICSILKIEILEERVGIDDGDAYVGFVRVISELVGDVSERLVYRAHSYAKDDILGYNPAPGDVAYPDKLQMMQEIAQMSAPLSRQASVTSIASGTSQTVGSSLTTGGTSAADLHGLWYPTVRRTVVCLSKLFKCLDAGVFQGISQEILSMCIESLAKASSKIVAAKGPLNSHLFFIKHLLILREQTAPFRGSYVFTEASMDLSKFKESAKTLYNHRSRLFSVNSSNALLEFLLQVPANVSEHTADGRRVLDLQLKTECQSFISEISRGFTVELDDFIQKANVFVSLGKSNAEPQTMKLSEQPFAKPESLHSTVSQAYVKIKSQWPVLQSHASLYIGNRETENILLTPIKKTIETAFVKLTKIVHENYTAEEQQVIGCPSSDEVLLLLSGKNDIY